MIREIWTSREQGRKFLDKLRELENHIVADGGIEQVGVVPDRSVGDFAFASGRW